MIYLYSETDSMNYFGSVEDETALTLSHERHAWLDYDECSYALAATFPVNETVKEIHVVQDHQQLYENGEQTFDIWLTWGIIFDFGDYQYSLEKSQGFSGLIFIEKGKDLIIHSMPYLLAVLTVIYTTGQPSASINIFIFIT